MAVGRRIITRGLDIEENGGMLFMVQTTRSSDESGLGVNGKVGMRVSG